MKLIEFYSLLGRLNDAIHYLNQSLKDESSDSADSIDEEWARAMISGCEAHKKALLNKLDHIREQTRDFMNGADPRSMTAFIDLNKVKAQLIASTVKQRENKISVDKGTKALLEMLNDLTTGQFKREVMDAAEETLRKVMRKNKKFKDNTLAHKAIIELVTNEAKMHDMCKSINTQMLSEVVNEYNTVKSQKGVFGLLSNNNFAGSKLVDLKKRIQSTAFNPHDAIDVLLSVRNTFDLSAKEAREYATNTGVVAKLLTIKIADPKFVENMQVCIMNQLNFDNLTKFLLKIKQHLETKADSENEMQCIKETELLLGVVTKRVSDYAMTLKEINKAVKKLAKTAGDASQQQSFEKLVETLINKVFEANERKRVMDCSDKFFDAAKEVFKSPHNKRFVTKTFSSDINNVMADKMAFCIEMAERLKVYASDFSIETFDAKEFYNQTRQKLQSEFPKWDEDYYSSAPQHALNETMKIMGLSEVSDENAPKNN